MQASACKFLGVTDYCPTAVRVVLVGVKGRYLSASQGVGRYGSTQTRVRACVCTCVDSLFAWMYV